MARQEGDAYPDPRRSGNKIKAVVCFGLLLIYLGGFVTAVAAPGDDYPDPRCAPGPIIYRYTIDELPAGSPLMTNQMLVME